MVYLVAVVVVGHTCDPVTAVASAVAAVTAFNFFFVPPRYGLAVENGDAQTAAQGNSTEAPPKPEHDRWVSHDPCVRHPHHRQRAAHRARDLAAASPCETRRCDEMLRH